MQVQLTFVSKYQNVSNAGSLYMWGKLLTSELQYFLKVSFAIKIEIKSQAPLLRMSYLISRNLLVL